MFPPRQRCGLYVCRHWLPVDFGLTNPLNPPVLSGRTKFEEEYQIVLWFDPLEYTIAECHKWSYSNLFYKLSHLFLKIIVLTILPYFYWLRVLGHKILVSFATISVTYPAFPVQDNWKRMKASLRCNATVYPVHIVGDRLSCINGLRKLSKRSGIYDML